MKIKKMRILVFSLIFSMFLILNNNNIYAGVFEIEDTDISIDVDESQWYVGTRGNYNNAMLNKLGITSDSLNNFMNNNFIYLYGVPNSNNEQGSTELLLTKKKFDKINNIINITKNDFSKEIKEYFGYGDSAEYEIYENHYRFMNIRYTDSSIGMNIENYSTIVNGYVYSIVLQKQSEISDLDRQKLKEMLDTIEFDIDYSLPEIYTSSTLEWIVIIKHGLIIIISGIIATLIMRLINMNRTEVIESKIVFIILFGIIIYILEKLVNI